MRGTGSQTPIAFNVTGPELVVSREQDEYFGFLLIMVLVALPFVHSSTRSHALLSGSFSALPLPSQ